MNLPRFSPVILFLVLSSACGRQEGVSKPEIPDQGKLFIIGGGERTDSMMIELVKLSGTDTAGYVFVLPMASSLPDSAIIWAREDFKVTGVRHLTGYNFKSDTVAPADKLDSLRNASLIYLSGGDQSRFMKVALSTPVGDAIRQAYSGGAVVSGTSAGAAVMSSKMITGNQLKHPDSESGFVTIESANVEIAPGLGLLDDVIIDQHFIKRQRLNRLLAVSAENPDQLCVGIDESTAIIVDGGNAVVTGIGQVVVVKNQGGPARVNHRGLIGQRDALVSIYLPGEKFRLR
ncbi:MAG: cyanophycinase [Bacteroidales bacterium]|jgi:cyanophycinase|nr:cyanophycinase [Bacteroidales bacterium]MCU0408185.1 cyanophycinase [Bacteroidales bacterium]